MALSPLDRIRLDKAAVDEGFGLRRPSEEAAGDAGNWLAYGSLGAPAALLLTRAAEGYVVAVDHRPGIAGLRLEGGAGGEATTLGHANLRPAAAALTPRGVPRRALPRKT